MATSSGLYNDRVKSIMNDRSSTDDRAQQYKESVEVKQTKNKLDKLDETTRTFQASLLKSALNSEEHLSHIAKYTKVMSRDTLTSNLLRIAKYGFYTYQALKLFKPHLIPNAIKRLEEFMKRSGYGARGMQNGCCCDSRGMAGKMGRRSRRMERRTQTPNTSYEASRRSTERMDRSRQASMDRAERIRRNADDLRQRKVSQIQAKHVQDAINKSMKKWNHTTRSSIKGIFDSSGVGLRTASKSLGKAAASSSSNLIKMGLAAIGGMTAAMSGILSAGLNIAVKGASAVARGGMALGRGAAAAGGAGLAFARSNPRLLARGTGALAGGYAAHRYLSFDPKNDFGTSKYINQSGLGDQYIGRSGSALSGLLSGLTFGAIDLDRFTGNAGRELNEAYFKKHGKYLGAPTNFAQYLQEGDDAIGRLFGMDRGVISSGGNYLGSQIGSGWRELKSYFFGIEEAIEGQTEDLSKRLDTNFKKMNLNSKEARKLTEEDKANLRKLGGIPEDQGHNIPFSPVYPRPETPKSHLDSDGANSAFTTGAKQKSDAQTFKNLLDPTTTLTGATVRSSGWSQHDASGYSEPTPAGFTGSAGGHNQLYSTKPSNRTPWSGGFVDPASNPSVNQDVLGRYNGKRVPVVIRNNNPGAISITGDEASSWAARQPGYVGMTPRPANEGGHYAKYATPEHGVHAASNLLKDYGRKGYNTTDKIVRRWSTDKSAHAGYSRNIQKYLKEAGISDPSGILNLEDPKVREAIIKGKSAWESGAGNPIYSDDTFKRGVAGDFGGSAVDSKIASLIDPSKIGLSTTLAEIPGGSASQIAIDMHNKNATRNKDISPELKNIMQYAASQSGISRIAVTSGGQDPAGKKGARRVGTSTNHDHGNAADFDMYVTNPDGTERKLKYSSAEDRKIIESFVENATKAGATNVGIGPGYMADGRMHLGNTGTDGRVWGKTMTKSSAEANIEAAAKRGISQRSGFDLASELSNGSRGIAPIPVEIASISNKTHEDNLARYSQSNGLGSIFGINKAAASELPDHLKGSQSSIKGGRLGSGMYQNSSTGAFIEDRISQAHVSAEKIRPNVNPEASVINASQGVTIPPSVDFSQNIPTVNTPKPADPVADRMNPSTINHYADPELMYPLLYHHMGN